jgi:dephospho-CoA kinase
LVVFDIPLLAESKTWRQRLDRVLVIDCSAGVQIERVEARSGWTADEVRSAMERQSSRSARRAIADAVLLNEGHDPRELSVAVWTLGAAGFFGTWAAPAPM